MKAKIAPNSVNEKQEHWIEGKYRGNMSSEELLLQVPHPALRQYTTGIKRLNTGETCPVSSYLFRCPIQYHGTIEQE